MMHEEDRSASQIHEQIDCDNKKTYCSTSVVMIEAKVKFLAVDLIVTRVFRKMYEEFSQLEVERAEISKTTSLLSDCGLSQEEMTKSDAEVLERECSGESLMCVILFSTSSEHQIVNQMDAEH